MKLKLFILCTILGGVMFKLGNRIISPLIEAIPPLLWVFLGIGGIVWGISFYTLICVYGGKVWGIKIKAPAEFAIKQFLSMIGGIVGGFFMLYSVLCAFTALLSGRISETVLSLVCYWGLMIIAQFVSKPINEKMLARKKYALCLGELPIFKAIDAEISNAAAFVVAFEGVALYSETDYCYAVYRYTDYQLGELSIPAEVAMVGTYFVQKYSKEFTFKVDMEVIPGEPGRTVVAVGAGGVAVGRIAGVPDQRIFRSYIFTRRA